MEICRKPTSNTLYPGLLLGARQRGPSDLRIRKSEASQRIMFPSEVVAMWNAVPPPGSQVRGLHSHILLAACAYPNSALEDKEGGVFTRALHQEKPDLSS